MVLWKPFEGTELALPLSLWVQAVFIPLVTKFVCVSFQKGVVKLLFEIQIGLQSVLFLLLQLLSRTEVLHCREFKRSFSFKSRLILVGPQVAFEVENRFISNALLRPYQMLKSRTVTSVLNIDIDRNSTALPRVLPLKHLIEPAWLLGGLPHIYALASFFALEKCSFVLDVLICIQTCHVLRFLKMFLKCISFSQSFDKSLIPFIHVIVVKWRWLWNGRCQVIWLLNWLAVLVDAAFTSGTLH